MVQTFVPHATAEACAAALDNKRLNKQINEARQILRALEWLQATPSPDGKPPGYLNHPATLMWEGYADALAYYHNACMDEWARRFNKNGKPTRNTRPRARHAPTFSWPPWFGWRPLMLSHRRMLLSKDQAHYGAKFDSVPAEFLSFGYVWPTRVPAGLRWLPEACAADVCVPLS